MNRFFHITKLLMHVLEVFYGAFVCTSYSQTKYWKNNKSGLVMPLRHFLKTHNVIHLATFFKIHKECTKPYPTVSFVYVPYTLFLHCDQGHQNAKTSCHLARGKIYNQNKKNFKPHTKIWIYSVNLHSFFSFWKSTCITSIQNSKN